MFWYFNIFQSFLFITCSSWDRGLEILFCVLRCLEFLLIDSNIRSRDNCYQTTSSADGETLRCSYVYTAFIHVVFFSLSTGSWSTQGKLEGRKPMTKQEITMNYFDFLGPVSPSKETTATTKERPNLLVEVKAKT